MPQIIPFLTVFSMGTMVGLMVFVMMTNTRTWLGGACFGMSLTSAVWALGLYNTMTQVTEASRILWYQVSAFGWCLYPMAFLLFALEITRMGTPRRRTILLTGTGLLGVLFLVAIWLDPMLFIGRFDRSRWGWGMTKPGGSPILVICILYMVATGLAHVVLLLNWGWRTRYRRERKQAYLLAATGAFTVVASAVYDILLPVFDIPTLGTTPMFASVFFLALFYCAYRYRLLEPTPPVSASDIMRRVRDLMIILDRDGAVVQMNASARDVLGYGVNELIGKPWTRILPDMALPEGDRDLSCDAELRDHQGARIPAQVTVSQRYNPDGDCVGYVLTAYDMRMRLALELQSVERQISEARFQDVSSLHRAVLDEARLGFLLLGPDACVTKGYAPRCAAAFDSMDLVGVDFVDMMLSEAGEEEKAQVRDLIISLIREGHSWRTDSLLKLLPATCERNGHAIGIRYSLSNPAAPDGDRFLLVLLEDRTEKEKHETQLSLEHDRLKMVVAILLNREAFREFLQEVRTWHLLQQQTNPEMLGNRGKWLQELYRDIHTFKGGFLRFGLRRTADRFMQFESGISELLQREPDVADIRMMLTQCDPECWMTEELQLLHDAIGHSFLAPSSTVEVDRNELERVAEEVSARIRAAGLPPDELRGILHRFRELYSVHAKRLLLAYEPYVQTISRERGLLTPVFAVQGMDVLLDGKQYSPFFRVLVHVFNNIVAHAIESPDERVAAAKPAQARIECHVERREGKLLLEIADDGRGIDPDRIRRERKLRAGDDELPEEDDRTVIQHIFEPGYSSVLRADTLSGRGIGLFAVAHAARQLGGTVWVQSRLGAFTRFLISIPLNQEQDERRRA